MFDLSTSEPHTRNVSSKLAGWLRLPSIIITLGYFPKHTYRWTAGEDERSVGRSWLVEDPPHNRCSQRPRISFGRAGLPQYILYFLFQWIYGFTSRWVFQPWSSWISNVYRYMFSGSVSLENCMCAFFAADYLRGDDMYSCEKCEKLRNGVKQCRLKCLPEILCIHLKRFRHDTLYNTKINTRITFPLRDLDLQVGLNVRNSYNLNV